VSKKADSENMVNTQSFRVERVASSARAAMSKIFSKLYCIDKNLDGLHLTVTQVKVSSDLRLCSFFVLPEIGSRISSHELIHLLNQNKKRIRFLLSNQMQLKYAPEIRFVQEIGVENEIKVADILKDIGPLPEEESDN
jgi:ribosome-binding factor A